jgi:hypothetical protein
MLFVRLVGISPLCGILDVVLRSPAASRHPDRPVRAGFGLASLCHLRATSDGQPRAPQATPELAVLPPCLRLVANQTALTKDGPHPAADLVPMLPLVISGLFLLLVRGIRDRMSGGPG